MKNTIDKFLVLVFIFVQSLLTIAHAQTSLKCGPVTLDTLANQKAAKYLSNTNNRPLYITPILVQVYFHILYCDDGSLPAATPEQLDIEFDHLVTGYKADNICFNYMGYDRIYNTKLDTNFNSNSDPASLFNQYRISNCINVFYTQKIKGNNKSCPGGCDFGGVTLGIPNTFCIVAISNLNDQANTISHEVGHCFGLLHTFNEGYGYENIDGSNGATSADLVQDTNADPYNYDTSCNKTGKGCTYIGTCKDPKGQTNFTPQYNNIMSYWCGSGNINSEYFTNGQFTRIESFINTNAPLGACRAADYVTEGPYNLTNSNKFISANLQLNTKGIINITGSSLVTYGGGKIILSEGFKASPLSGKVIIRPKKCN